MKTIHKNLSLITLDLEKQLNTCGYWYLIHENNSSFTAFQKRENLLKWMKERNLELTEKIPAHGVWSWQQIHGSFADMMHMDKNKFSSIDGFQATRKLSNGDYTLGKITDCDGFKTIHYLNPNVKERVVYDYQESRLMFG